MRRVAISKAVLTCWAAMALLVTTGCASDQGDPCMRKLAEYAKPKDADGLQWFGSRLPVAPDLFKEPSFGRATWMVLEVSPASAVISPGAIYAVTLPAEADGMQVALMAACDVERTYVVVSEGGFGSLQRAFGPLNRGR